MEGAYILVFIRNGANLAHIYLQTDANEAEMKKKLKIFTVRLVMGSSFDSVFC